MPVSITDIKQNNDSVEISFRENSMWLYIRKLHTRIEKDSAYITVKLTQYNFLKGSSVVRLPKVKNIYWRIDKGEWEKARISRIHYLAAEDI